MKIIHIHGFKCGGSTFSWILSQVFGERLFYVEPATSQSGTNAPCKLNLNYVLNKLPSNCEAITSHNIAIPCQRAFNDNPPLIVTFIRKPEERLMSAFKFMQTKQKTIPSDYLFEDFVYSACAQPIPNGNYFSRLLAPQPKFDTSDYSNWDILCKSDVTKRDDVFIGILEGFNSSLILLEKRLFQRFDSLYDLSYPVPANASQTNTASEIELLPKNVKNKLHELNLLDNTLYDIALSQMQSQFKLITDEDRENFKQRCDEKRKKFPTISARPPNQWTYL